MSTRHLSVFALVALGLASGCGKKSESESEKTPPPAEAPATDKTTEKDVAAEAAKPDSEPVANADAAPTAANTVDAAPTPAPGTAEAAGEEAEEEIPFESHYVGKHKLGVNRVNDGKRNGPGRIYREVNALVLDAKVENGEYRLAINGIVKPVSETEFVLDGTLVGVPNLEYRNEPAKERTTEGSFRFKSTKGRKYWRLYEIDGKECVCNDGCGNEFCYIDLAF